MAEPTRDVYCGFKLWHGAAAEAVFPLQTLEGWTFDAEVLALARRLGFSVREVGIVWADRDGSRLSIREVLLPVVRELLAARRNVRRQERGTAEPVGPRRRPSRAWPSRPPAPQRRQRLPARDGGPPLLARAAGDRAAGGVAIRVLYTLLEAPWPPAGLDDQFYFSALPRAARRRRGLRQPVPVRPAGRRSSLPTAEHPPAALGRAGGPGRARRNVAGRSSA